MLKTLAISTAAGALMIGAAFAEGAPPSSSSPPAQTQPARPDAAKSMPAPGAQKQFVTAQKPDQYLASSFKGTDVIGSDNEKIGDVSDILFDKDGKIEAYVISVGGFLGMGAKEVALAPSSFQVVPGDKSKNEADKLKLTMTKDELKQAANFEPLKTQASTTGRASPDSPSRTAPSR